MWTRKFCQFLIFSLSISGSTRFVDQRRVKIHILAEAENQTQTPPVGYYVILPCPVCLSIVSYMSELKLPQCQFIVHETGSSAQESKFRGKKLLTNNSPICFLDTKFCFSFISLQPLYSTLQNNRRIVIVFSQILQFLCMAVHTVISIQLHQGDLLELCYNHHIHALIVCNKLVFNKVILPSID